MEKAPAHRGKEQEDLCYVYALAILHDGHIPITVSVRSQTFLQAENVAKLLQASGNPVDLKKATLFAELAADDSIQELIAAMGVGPIQLPGSPAAQMLQRTSPFGSFVDQPKPHP